MKREKQKKYFLREIFYIFNVLIISTITFYLNLFY